MKAKRSPEISVVTVVLNDLVGLTKTIKSIQEQIGISLEHLIVDGGSTDGSAILAELNSDVPIESRPDGGIYNAMQRGLDLATGRYVIFTNAGDSLFGISFLAKAVRLLEASESQWGFGPLIEESTRGSDIWTPVDGEISISKVAYRKTYIPFPATIFSRDSINGLGGFKNSYSIAGDFDLIVRLTNQVLPIRWDFPIARFSAGGVSYTNAPLAWSEERMIRREQLRLSKFLTTLDLLSGYKKSTKWRIGKLLDLLQKSGMFGKRHWRDRCAPRIPIEFQIEIPPI